MNLWLLYGVKSYNIWPYIELGYYRILCYNEQILSPIGHFSLQIKTGYNEPRLKRIEITGPKLFVIITDFEFFLIDQIVKS